MDLWEDFHASWQNLKQQAANREELSLPPAQTPCHQDKMQQAPRAVVAGDWRPVSSGTGGRSLRLPADAAHGTQWEGQRDALCRNACQHSAHSKFNELKVKSL